MFHIYFTQSLPSITDWIQAFGTFGIIATLLLQYNSNKTQQKQLRISLIPKFNVTSKEEEYFLDEDYNAITLTITLERNISYAIRFVVVDSGNAKIHDYYNLDRSLTDGRKFEISATYLKNDEPAGFSFNLEFEDALGNAYVQNFTYFANQVDTAAPFIKKN